MLRLLLTTAVLIPSVVRGADSDPVKDKLDKAKTVFAAETKKFQDEVVAYLANREGAARKDGNKKLVDQIKEERTAFEERDEAPATTPKAARQKYATARAAMEKAFETAVKEYTKAKKDDDAATIEKELTEFRKSADPSDTRRRWVHAKGSYTSLGAGNWEEKSPDGTTYKWKETARTKDYVELQATIFGVEYAVRLGSKSADYQSGKANFKPKFFGKWSD